MENVQKIRELEKLAKEDVKNANTLITIRQVLYRTIFILTLYNNLPFNSFYCNRISLIKKNLLM